MTHKNRPPEERETVNLKDPAWAALLAWLIPGLGHLYQGRTAKAVLLFVCIMGTFVYGLYLGGNSKLGWGRVVYASWTADDKRLPYLCQIGVGLPAMPALIQASRVRRGNPPHWGGFMAPPRNKLNTSADPQAPTIDELNKGLSHFFELGTVYTMIAGLLNVLAIYDAWGGPVFFRPKEEEGEQNEPQQDSQKVPAGADS